MSSEFGPRITAQVMSVLLLMLEAPDASWYGLELARKTGIKTGTIYPVLARLERAGWLESAFETVDPAIEKRPRRRLYKLTGVGETAARQRALETGYVLPPVTARQPMHRPAFRPIPRGAQG
jgi:DNA-binding PadR family transcriptional regulator